MCYTAFHTEALGHQGTITNKGGRREGYRADTNREGMCNQATVCRRPREVGDLFGRAVRESSSPSTLTTTEETAQPKTCEA